MRYYINLRKKTCQRIWRGESKKPGRSLRLFLVYLLDNGVSFHGAGDEGASGKIIAGVPLMPSFSASFMFSSMTLVSQLGFGKASSQRRPQAGQETSRR